MSKVLNPYNTWNFQETLLTFFQALKINIQAWVSFYDTWETFDILSENP